MKKNCLKKTKGGKNKLKIEQLTKQKTHKKVEIKIRTNTQENEQEMAFYG